MKVGEVRHAERSAAGKPLDGIRVLAIEQMQALPYATQLMAYLGADVVKIEHPVTGDSGRGALPTITDEDGREVGATFLRNNLSKRSLAIDLKNEAGRDLCLRLVPQFDVVAENMRRGAMERLGLGYEVIRARHPAAIFLSISGFGTLTDSPYAAWPAYAPVVEAMAGIYEPNRLEGQPPPIVVAGALGDNASALFSVIGVLSALRHRERTGGGQLVDISMYDASLAMADMVPQLWSLGASPKLAAAGGTAIAGAFAAKDGYFVVTVFREHHFERLAQLVGHAEWVDDPRFATRAGWAQQIEPEIRPALESWARDKTKLEASSALCEAGIAAGPSNVAEDLWNDPHVRQRDMLIEVPRPDAEDPMLVVGNPVKLSKVAEGPVTRFPRLGQHTDEVLREILDLSDGELDALRDDGAIG